MDGDGEDCASASPAPSTAAAAETPATAASSCGAPVSPEPLLSVRVDTGYEDTDEVAAAAWRAESDSARKSSCGESELRTQLFSDACEASAPSAECRRRPLLSFLRTAVKVAALAAVGAAAASAVSQRRRGGKAKKATPA